MIKWGFLLAPGQSGREKKKIMDSSNQYSATNAWNWYSGSWNNNNKNNNAVVPFFDTYQGCCIPTDF